VHKRIISAVKRVEFVSDRMSYIILRGRWCHIIVLNGHVPVFLYSNIVSLVLHNLSQEVILWRCCSGCQINIYVYNRFPLISVVNVMEL
jgi:hypothetical protein